MSSETPAGVALVDDVVVARDLTKHYVLYKSPSERLLHPITVS